MVRALRAIRKSGTAVPPKHWRGTKGARDVLTSYFKDGLIAAHDAIMARGLLALLGHPGVGKTFLVKTVAERFAIPFHYLECGPNVHGRQQTIAMLLAIGWPHDPRESPATLRATLVEACVRQHQVFALDEIDRWGRDGVQLIQYLWSQSGNETAFIFVGFKIGKLIKANPALDSRIEHRVQFSRLDLEETRKVLREYHKVFELADETILDSVYKLTGGEFRGFAILLSSILRKGGAEPVLTSELLERAWLATGRPWSFATGDTE